uniref:Uncharacterized protein n=1 Tax=Physcomitrium patens TaxID=3218 RepID=A0A7I3ZY77_PHYPA
MRAEGSGGRSTLSRVQKIQHCKALLETISTLDQILSELNIKFGQLGSSSPVEIPQGQTHCGRY